MMWKKSFVFVLCMGLILAATGRVGAQNPENLDKGALDELKLMSDTISGAKTVRFEALSMVPVKSPDGMWINLYGSSSVVMQGQDKLFASTAGDFAARNFYFDGKNITAYSPAKNIYAVKPAPATISVMIKEEHERNGKSFPYADLLISEPYAVMANGLKRALYVGQSTIGGVKTSHLAFSNKDVDWQIWIGETDHLPRLVVATYLDDASEPSYTVEFKNWKLNEPVEAAEFVFNNATKAAQIEFRDPEAATGRV